MNRKQILKLMQGSTRLNRVRLLISSGAARMEQQSIQDCDIFEMREMEFELAIKVAEELGIDLTKDIPNDESS